MRINGSLKADTCANCRSKFAAGRQRCPRCYARVVKPSAAEGSASTASLKWLGAVLVLAVATLGIAALLRPEPSEAAVPHVAALPDPLAARRRPPADEADSRPGQTEPTSFDEAAYAAGDGARALAQLKDVADRKPDDAQALTSVAQMLVRLGRTAEALPHLHRAVTLEPGKAAYRVNLANALAQSNRLQDAVDAYREAQRILPSDSTTVFQLASTLQKMGEHRAAVEEFQNAISLDRTDAAARLGLAQSYDALKRWPEAIEEYNAYLQLAPSSPDAPSVRAHVSQLGRDATPSNPKSSNPKSQ